MSSVYNGVAANATGSTVAVTIPSDGDTDNAADLNAGTKRAADWLQRVWNLVGAIFTTANSWTAAQTFSAGVDMANTYIHNLWPPSAGTDAANLNTVTGAVAAAVAAGGSAPTVVYPALHSGVSGVSGGVKPCYWQDLHGAVHVQGEITWGGGAGSVEVFDPGTIPSGMRPAGSRGLEFAAAKVNASPSCARVQIDPNGSIWIQADAVFTDAVFSASWLPGTNVTP
jgi:hypothetical protein